jgi:hypothetical protein
LITGHIGSSIVFKILSIFFIPYFLKLITVALSPPLITFSTTFNFIDAGVV